MMPIRNRLTIGLLLLYIAVGGSYAPGQVLPFEPYTIKDGLLSNDILTINQDSEGYLWIATRDGLSVFDGHQFTNLTTANGLPSSSILEIAEDRSSSSKTLWLLGPSGLLAKWSHGRCARFDYDSTRSWSGNITSLCVDASGILWAGTEDTLIQIVGDRLRPVRTGSPVQFPHMISEQGDSVIWIASRSGLLRYTESTGTFTSIPLGQFENKLINALAFDDDGAVWAGVKDGFILRIEQTRVVGWRKTEPFSFLVRDKRGTFWFGSYRGLFRVTDPLLPESQIETLTVDNGLSENTLREAFIDREDNLWLGGITQGLVKLADEYAVKFPMRDINPPYQYSVGASDLNSHIWVVARSGLWEFWRGKGSKWYQAKHERLEGTGTAVPFPVFDVESQKKGGVSPYSLFCPRDSILWIVYSNAQIASYAIQPGERGASRLRLLKTLRAGREVPHEFPKSVIVDHRGLLWCCVGTRILMLDPNLPQPLLRSFDEVPVSPGSNSARALFEDNAGSIWAGFLGGGVMRLAGDSLTQGAFRPVKAVDGLPDNAVSAFCQDSLGRVWAATEGTGVLVQEGDRMKRLTSKEGLKSNTILSILAEPPGKIWFGSSNGISHMNASPFNAAVQPSMFLGEQSVQSGMTRDTTLWFVGRTGLLLYKRSREAAERSTPTTIITSFQVNGEAVNMEGERELLYNENSCSIGFVAPTFRDPTAVAYQYRLIGVDTVWSRMQRQGRVTFAALPPGNYTFEVRASIIDAPSVSLPALLRFNIASPFWKRWWFALLLWLILAGTVAMTIRYFEKRKMLARMRALEMQRALDQERLRISRDMHDEVGSALTEITYLSELAKQKPDAAASYIQQISDRSSDVIDNVSEIVWAMNPHNDTLDNLLAHVRRYSAKYLDLAGIRCAVNMPENIPSFRISGQDRRSVFLVVKEALHNVAKHSKATEVLLSITLQDVNVEVTIRDNGCGYLSSASDHAGHGLENMRRRLEGMQGECLIQSDPGSGTQVTARFRVTGNQIT